MTTARDFLNLVPVLNALATQAGDLPARYMTYYEGGELGFVLDSRDEVLAWGKFLGTYEERAMGDGRLIYEARGAVAGHRVSAFSIGEPS